MSRKRAKKPPETSAPAVPEEIMAEGSGPHADAPEVDAAAVPEMADDGTLAVAAVQPASEDGEPRGKGKRGRRKREVEADVEADVAIVEEAAAADEPEPVEAEAELGEIAEIAEIAEDDPRDHVAAIGTEQPDGDIDAAADIDASAEVDAAGEVDGDEPSAALPTSAASMDAKQLKHLVEALVFASDRPVTLLRLRQLTRVADVTRLEQALAELAADFAERGLILQQVSGGYQFRTQTRYSAWVQQLIAGRPVRLSRAQLETLAIVAYRQPITRPEIDEIRGVDSSGTLKVLLDRALVRVLGKKEEVGRPMLYGTTKEFLDFFSLGDLRELPTLREYSELTPESRRVMTDKLGVPADEAPAPVDALADGSGGVAAVSELAERLDAEAVLPADAADGERLADAADGERLADAADGERLADAADGERLADAADGERLADAADGERLADAADGERRADDDELADPAVLAEAAAVARALAADHDDVDTEIAARLEGDELDAAPPLDPSDDLLAEPDPQDEILD